MKNDLILKKFLTQPETGTFSLKEKTFFFGSKMMEIEDSIIIDDNNIQYYQINEPNSERNGFQNFNLNLNEESVFNLDLNLLKNNNHNIFLYNQTETQKKINTKWEMRISAREILLEYLFSKIKENRSFKALKSNVFLNNNINLSIRSYINENILNRYKFSKINLYIKYININNELNSYDGNQYLQYNPIYTNDIFLDENLVKDVNVVANEFNFRQIILNFNQTKPGEDYTFYYYFTLEFFKI